MTQICNEELKKYTAWPISLLHKGKKGEICGYVMSRVFNYEQINMLYSHYYRKFFFPRANWKFIIRAATNLAISCSVIRRYGFIIEDTDEVNVLVNDHAEIKLIDCGSFRIGNQKWNKLALKFYVDKFILVYTSFLILLFSCFFPVNPCLRILRVVNKIL
jgi:DNA-binding helix-hairpin-helix protein with protein kinase domain